MASVAGSGSSTVTILTSLFLIIFVGGGVMLQIFLSRRQNKWLGLILPGITFAYSLLMLLSVAVYDSMGGREVLGLIASVFLMGNIPTIVLLGIYAACREKLKRKREIDKMNIQDLS